MADVGVERIAQHPLREVGHAWNIDERLDRRMLQVAEGCLRDIDGEVTDPLQIVVDLEARYDDADIVGARVVVDQQFVAALVDLDLEVVDRFVTTEHLLGPDRGHD